MACGLNPSLSSDAMNPDIVMVFATLPTAVVLFVTGSIRNDLVALLDMLMAVAGLLGSFVSSTRYLHSDVAAD